MRNSRLFAVLITMTVAFGAYAVVSPVSAGTTRTQHDDVTISTDSDFDSAHGVRSGSGTQRNPYVISGWEMGNLVIQNTDRYIAIRNNNIAGTVVLDWIGDRLDLRDNTIGDLRVNQDVPRTGLPTSGTISHNAFRVVGQLRHWDGVFSHNVVGSMSDGMDTRGNQAVNFDGFNGAHFERNTIYGYVDARLHGHHHSSGFGKPSHNHTHDMSSMETTHRYRYHQVSITNNRIYSNASYALAYLDTGHSGNDRTGNSETDTNLNKPHIHYTHVNLSNNELHGAGIFVDVFNAPDDLHPWLGRGLVHVSGNRITLNPDNFTDFRELQGIQVLQATDLKLEILDNVIVGQKGGSMLPFLEDMDTDAGILLNTLDDAEVVIAHNQVANRVYGVNAMTFTDTVRWTVRDLKTSKVHERVHYDSSVPNKPD